MVKYKIADISKEDLINFAHENNISNPEKIISQIAEAIIQFPEIAEKYSIPAKWRVIIQKSLRSNLEEFGYKLPMRRSNKMSLFKNLTISVNNKGYYVISVEIYGRVRRRFIRPGTEAYDAIQNYEMGKMEQDDFNELIAQIFSKYL